MNDSIKALGDKLRHMEETPGVSPDDIPDEVLEIIAKDKVLSALSVAYDVGGDNTDKLVKALHKFSCVPSNCDLAGFSRTVGGADAMTEFFGLIGKAAELRSAGKMTDSAYTKFGEVLKQLGQHPNRARGAAEVVGAMVKLADEAEAAGKTIQFTDFELPRVTILNGAGKRIKGREMDLSVKIDGEEFFYEMKAWDPNLLVDRLIKSLRGKTDDLDEIKEADQFQADLMDMILRSMPDKIVDSPTTVPQTLADIDSLDHPLSRFVVEVV